MNGIITEIQRFSLADGPGIRTAVFFKGCNMACAWCHNPETIRQEPQLMQYQEHCIGCHNCIAKCPEQAIEAVGAVGSPVVLAGDKCRQCGSCAAVCFPGAFAMSGTKVTVNEIMDEIMQDGDYYRNSGGGVTLSGGEVLVQPDFAHELLTECRQHKVPTAIETNLNVPWETVERILPVTELVMADVKIADSKEHQRWTGVGNEQIMINMERLAAAKLLLIIRTPVIPGVNDRIEAISEIAARISKWKANLLYYELLNYNPLGEQKYRVLDQDYYFAGQKPADAEKMRLLAEAARKFGLSVRCA